MTDFSTLIDQNTLTLLQMNDATYMNEKQKEMLRQWNNLSTTDKDLINKHLSNRGPPILMKTTFVPVSIINKEQIPRLLADKKILHYMTVNDVEPYTQFTDIESGKSYLYRGIYNQF